jgi:5-(carboxyamino)imidazole ribonucleotide mutase
MKASAAFGLLKAFFKKLDVFSTRFPHLTRSLDMPPKPSLTPQISIIMGSSSDWPTLAHAADMLDRFSIPYEKQIVSAHRTPKKLYTYATTARERGIQIIIAGAGGAAHLPGMAAALTSLPVLGVPVESRTLKGLDSLLSIAQMPAGIPVGTLAIGKAGAINAALLAISILSLNNKALALKLTEFRKKQTESVLRQKL